MVERLRRVILVFSCGQLCRVCASCTHIGCWGYRVREDETEPSSLSMRDKHPTPVSVLKSSSGAPSGGADLEWSAL